MRTTLNLDEDVAAQLTSLSRHRGTSVNRLMEEMTTLMLAEFDAETRFLARAACGRGRSVRGLALLAKATRRK